ncbi:MAG: hypothetical protein PHU71_01115 [Candidatus Gracilibacteria bacterium]|nr:hypothetical protein [Candidatus Gracilibacteria bacterium]
MKLARHIHYGIWNLLLVFFAITASSSVYAAAPVIGRISPHYEFTNTRFPLSAEGNASGGSGNLSKQWCLQYPASTTWTRVATTANLDDYYLPSYPNGIFPGLGYLKFIANAGAMVDCSVDDDGHDIITIQTPVYFKNNTPICDASPEILRIHRGDALASCTGASGYDASSEYSYTESSSDPDDPSSFYDLAYKWILSENGTQIASFDDIGELGCFNLTSAQTGAMDLEKNYKIEFRASDCGMGQSDCNTVPNTLPYCKDTLKIELVNQAPIAQIEPSLSYVLSGETKQFTGTITDPEDDYNLNYEWLINTTPRNDDFFLPGETTTTMTIPANLAKGNHVVKLRAQDLNATGEITEVHAGIQVVNHPPVNVSITPRYLETYLEETVSFSSSAAIDPDSASLTYTMYALDDVDEEPSPETQICQSRNHALDCNYTPEKIGTKYILLRVSDNEGLSVRRVDTYAKLVVKNHSPSVYVNPVSGIPDLGTPLTLTATASDEDATNLLMSYSWSEGGSPILGCINTTSSSCTIPVAGLSPGIHTYTVLVNDNSGAISEPATATADITVRFYNSTPRAVIDIPASQLFDRTKVIGVKETFSLSGSASDVDGPSALSYVWSLRDTDDTLLGTCSGTLDLSGQLLPTLPDCTGLTVPEIGQYYATLELNDNETFPNLTTSVERVAIFAVPGDVQAWMDKGTVTIDNEDPVFTGGTLEGFVSEGDMEYISGDTGEYLSQSSNIAETSGTATDQYSGIRYVTLKLIGNAQNNSCSESSPYSATYDVLTGEWSRSDGGISPIIGFLPNPSFNTSTGTLSVDISAGPFAEDLAAKFDLCYRFEDMTAYHPVLGNLNSWSSGRLDQNLVLDAKKPEIEDTAFYQSTANNTPLAYCGESNWWTNQSDLTLKGSVVDIESENWESSGIVADSLELAITPDEYNAISSDPIYINLDNNNEWLYQDTYGEEHPLLNFSVLDRVGNLGYLQCIPNIDLTAPSLLSSNPEDGWLLLNLGSKLELILSEPDNSAHLDPNYDYPEHNLMPDSVQPNININLYDVSDDLCQKIDLNTDDFQVISRLEDYTHIIQLEPENDLAYNKSYRLVINGSDCPPISVSTALIVDLAGNELPRTEIEFNTPSGLSVLSLDKKALDPVTGNELKEIIPSETIAGQQHEIKFEITLKTDPDETLESDFDGPFMIRDLLPPYFEYIEESATYQIGTVSRPVSITPTPSTPGETLDPIQGKLLLWSIPAGTTVAPNEKLTITYLAKVSTNYIPEAFKQGCTDSSHISEFCGLSDFFLSLVLQMPS